MRIRRALCTTACRLITSSLDRAALSLHPAIINVSANKVSKRMVRIGRTSDYAGLDIPQDGWISEQVPTADEYFPCINATSTQPHAPCKACSAGGAGAL